MKQLRLRIQGSYLLIALSLSACGQKQRDQTTPQITDTNVIAADTARKSVYTALSTDSAIPTAIDTANPATKEMIGRFPAVNLVRNTFEHQSRSFMGVEGLDDVFTAEYQVGGARVRLFLTDDRSGLKYVRLTEFATRQSQVQGAAMDFDEGYSVVFHHVEYGWMLGGLKAGYLVGAVGYTDSSLNLISRWVKALK
jgi:hypothetical protein